MDVRGVPMVIGMFGAVILADFLPMIRECYASCWRSLRWRWGGFTPYDGPEDEGVLTAADRHGYRHGKNPIVSVETSQTQARREDHEGRNIQTPQDPFFNMVYCDGIFYYAFP
jgi:hypothetical protein